MSGSALPLHNLPYRIRPECWVLSQSNAGKLSASFCCPDLLWSVFLCSYCGSVCGGPGLIWLTCGLCAPDLCWEKWAQQPGGKAAPAENQSLDETLELWRNQRLTFHTSRVGSQVSRYPSAGMAAAVLEGTFHWFRWFNWSWLSLICRTQPAAAFLCPLMRFCCCKICSFHFRHNCHFSRNSFPLNATYMVPVTMVIASINRGKRNPIGQARRHLLRWSRAQRWSPGEAEKQISSV